FDSGIPENQHVTPNLYLGFVEYAIFSRNKEMMLAWVDDGESVFRVVKGHKNAILINGHALIYRMLVYDSLKPVVLCKGDVRQTHTDISFVGRVYVGCVGNQVNCQYHRGIRQRQYVGLRFA